MANSYFRFKQFTVFQDKCAMKVGTDGVLLGVWCRTENCKQILDIGCGTGLISLMLAQRSEAHIDAIDIDADACTQAVGNVDNSPFSKQINIIRSSLAEYAKSISDRHYDLIVSNPPYFINSMKCPDRQRNTARHTDTLSLPSLIADSKKFLAKNGRLCLILPFDQKNILSDILEEHRLYITRETTVYPTPVSPPKRILVECSFISPLLKVQDCLTIEIKRHCYSDDFTRLAKDYYLNL